MVEVYVHRYTLYVVLPYIKDASHRHSSRLTLEILLKISIPGHPKVLCFISHAGMGGTTEAIHHGVPILATPITGDQPANAASIEESGFGIQLSVNEMTKENLVDGVKKIIAPE